MPRSIAGNRTTNGSEHRPIVDQLVRRTTDRTINRGILRPPVRSIVASATDCTINRGIVRTIVQYTPVNRGILRLITRSIVASCDRSYDQSCRPRPTIGGATSRKVVQPIGTGVEYIMYCDFFDLLMTHNICSHITLPTRFSNKNGTIIDDIFCKFIPCTQAHCSGILIKNYPITYHALC